MIRRKGYWVKQSFDNSFVHCMEELEKKYPQEVFNIQGIANHQMDIALFSKDFFGKSGNVASLSVDANANVKEKNVAQYASETNKSIQRLNALYFMHKNIRKMRDEDTANEVLEKIINGEIFVSDLHNYHSKPYCYAFDLSNLLRNGMNFFHGNMKINPPKRSESFIALMIQSIAFISNQLAGACAFPDFFVALDWFYRKEFGEDYMTKMNESTQKFIKNQMQNFIYSVNFPFRSGEQSPFTNLSVMDRGYMNTMFSDYVFPDMTKVNVESAIELSKMFFEYYTEINGVEGMFTFPVLTLAISLDENGEYLDPDFVDWAAGANCDKALSNIYQGEPSSLSSCCRLKNDYSKISEAGFQNSFGVSGLSVGSHRVAGLNLARIAELEKTDKDIINHDLELIHDILYVHRKMIEERIDGGYLPLYNAGWVHLQKQYSTIGFVGAYEYLHNRGMNIQNKPAQNVIVDMMKQIENKIVDWQEIHKDEKIIYNIEQIPAESMAVRLSDLDRVMGYNDEWNIYSNQYIPLIEKAPISTRMEIQGKLDQLTSGGAILHINVDDDMTLSKEQYKRLMDKARKEKVAYFAVNYAFSECANGHYLTGKKKSCTICEAEIVNHYLRVVGFITPVSSWNAVRKNWEYDRREFYTNKEV